MSVPVSVRLSRSNQCSTIGVRKDVVSAILTVDDAYKRSLAANQKEQPMQWRQQFLHARSNLVVLYHITVNKMC